MMARENELLIKNVLELPSDDGVGNASDCDF